MPLADFLGENGAIPTGSAATSMTKTTTLPDWYTNGAMELFAQQKAISNGEYQTYDQTKRTAGFTPDQIASFGATRNAAGAYQPGLATANDWLSKAQGINAGDAARGGVNQAVNAAGEAISGGGGLSDAMPWLMGASGDVTNVDAYMDPYQRNVTDYMAELGQRNLNDVLLPGIEGRYIKSGQFNGSGKMTDTARAVRDVSKDILGTQAQYLSSGYKTAQEMKGADLTRMAGIGATAGTLGTAEQQAALDAAKLYGEAGKTMGTFAGEDAQRYASNAAQQAALAQQAQALGLTGAGALNTVGQQQQALNQSNLDVAYKDFQDERDWTQQQQDKLLETYGALGKGVPTSTTEEGIQPGNYQQQYGASTAEDIASAISGVGGLISDPDFQAFLKKLGIGG